MNVESLAFVALGANLGDAQLTVVQAMDRLQAWSRRALLRSSLWRTTPVDCPPGSPLFINGIAGFLPSETLTPEELLQELQAIEIAFGRKPKITLNEPRPLDLDLITFGQQTIRSASLILPHPRAHERRFVLLPLNEIAPDLVLPGQTRSVSNLLACLPSQGDITRID
jgi:2-amino-4-hydroxy-6-hydroxymethyldihydropteridine diphosphokinase